MSEELDFSDFPVGRKVKHEDYPDIDYRVLGYDMNGGKLLVGGPGGEVFKYRIDELIIETVVDDKFPKSGNCSGCNTPLLLMYTETAMCAKCRIEAGLPKYEILDAWVFDPMAPKFYGMFGPSMEGGVTFRGGMVVGYIANCLGQGVITIAVDLDGRILIDAEGKGPEFVATVFGALVSEMTFIK
jgi:hypothetical protein